MSEGRTHEHVGHDQYALHVHVTDRLIYEQNLSSSPDFEVEELRPILSFPASVPFKTLSDEGGKPTLRCLRVRHGAQRRIGNNMRIYSPIGEGNCCPAGNRETAASFGTNPLRVACRNVQYTFSNESDTTYIEPTEV